MHLLFRPPPLGGSPYPIEAPSFPKPPLSCPTCTAALLPSREVRQASVLSTPTFLFPLPKACPGPLEVLPSPFVCGLVCLGVDSYHSCRNSGQNSVGNAVLGKISSSLQDFYSRSRRKTGRIFESIQSTHCLFPASHRAHGNTASSIAAKVGTWGFYHLGCVSRGMEGKHSPEGMPASLSAGARAHKLCSGPQCSLHPIAAAA